MKNRIDRQGRGVSNEIFDRRGTEFVFRKITHTAAMIKLGLATELRLGNLDAHRDWCYAKDAVAAMWLMLQQEQPDDYIIASGETHSVRELVECAFNYLGLNWQDYVVVDPSFYRPDSAPTVFIASAFSASKLILAFNFDNNTDH